MSAVDVKVNLPLTNVSALVEVPEDKSTGAGSHHTSGSFHINSTNLWMFFHEPPRIVLKIGTFVEHVRS